MQQKIHIIAGSKRAVRLSPFGNERRVGEGFFDFTEDILPKLDCFELPLV